MVRHVRRGVAQSIERRDLGKNRAMNVALIEILAIAAPCSVLIFGKTGVVLALPALVLAGWLGWKDGSG